MVQEKYVYATLSIFLNWKVIVFIKKKKKKKENRLLSQKEAFKCDHKEQDSNVAEEQASVWHSTEPQC